MGTLWFLTIYSPKGLHERFLTHLQEYFEKELRDFEDRFSRFIPRQDGYDQSDSDYQKMVEISQLFFEATEGIFDIRINKILTETGYGLEQNLHLEYDFGGIGKGYFIDKLGRNLKKLYPDYGFMINGGGDILHIATILAGHPGGIILENPYNPSVALGSISIYNQAICSSSNSKRKWTKNNQHFDHFIPKQATKETLKKDSLIFATVIAPSCMIADMIATVICLLEVNDLPDHQQAKIIENLREFFEFQVLELNAAHA